MKWLSVHLEGEWCSRVDGEVRGQVEGGLFHWEEDGTTTELSVHCGRRDVVSMTVDGVGCSAVLSEDHKMLRWADGDVWARVLPEGPLERSLNACGLSDLELEDHLEWSKWSTSRHPSCGPYGVDLGGGDGSFDVFFAQD